MNGRQLFFFLAGLVIFLAGVYFGLRPVEAPLSPAGPDSARPLLDLMTAIERRPERVILAATLMVAGVATAIGGSYVSRDRR